MIYTKQLDDTALLIVYPDPTGEYPFRWRIVWSDGESAERPAVSVDDAVDKAYELLLWWDTL